MATTKQEIAADLVWRYVERVREAEAAGDSAAFTHAELEQLVLVLETAGQVPDALASEGPAECQRAVRRRIDQIIAAPAAPKSQPEPQATTAAAPSLPALVPAWRFWAVASLAAALCAAVVTVGYWHRAPQQVRVVRVPRDVDDVEPVDEEKVHRLLPLMVKNQLPPQQEKNLMWHMLVCPGCFDHYRQLKQDVHAAARTPLLAKR